MQTNPYSTVDRNGKPVRVGSLVKIVGHPRDSTIYFNSKMTTYLNNGIKYRVVAIKSYTPKPVAKLKGAGDWSWCPKNLEVVYIPVKKIEPVLFNTELLDI
jgi:hypothetical protein